MIDEKPHWYKEARGGLTDGPVFTEQMKRNVRKRIEERSGRKYSRRYLMGATAACMVIGLGIWLSFYATTDRKAASEGPSDVASEEIPLAFADATTSPGDYSTDGSGAERVELRPVDEAAIVRLETTAFDGVGEYVEYELKGGDGQPYFGIAFDGATTGSHGPLYEIGPGAFEPGVKLEKSRLFGRDQVKIAGSCGGVTCYYSDWITLSDGAPVRDFHLDIPSYEVDLDGDGTTEAVGIITSTTGSVLIYKAFGDQTRYVSVNVAVEATHPDSVVFDERSKEFKALFPDRTVVYRYASGKDELVRVGEADVASDR